MIQRIPYSIVILSDLDDKYHHGVYAFITMMDHLNATCNPYIYMLLNPGFKSSYRNFRGRTNNANSASTLNHSRKSVQLAAVKAAVKNTNSKF
jgi:hypothetical protein